MDTLESLSSQLETTEDIGAIVSTMKSLSSASIRQYERAVEAMAYYRRTVALGLQVVLREGAPPRPWRAGSGRRGLIVIGSDRGLCGRFNDRVADAARDRLNAADAPAFLFVLGIRAAARLETAGHAPDRLFTLPGSVQGLASTVQSVAVEVDRAMAAHGLESFSVLFTERGMRGLGEAVEEPLVPIPDAYLHELATAPWPGPSLPICRMNREALFSWLIRQQLFVVLYRALAESLAAEHAARLAAMQRAEKNIDERRETLLGQYRQKRQETITRELMDVVAGFESVRGRD